MRLVAGTAALALFLLATPAAAAAAGPQRLCTITDDRVDEPSGLGLVPGGYVTMNDSSDLASHRKIFFLDHRCRVTRVVGYPSRPRDPEDLAVTPDGTVWVGDIGDNDRSRQTVALWRLRRGAQAPTLYRLTYPDRAHDAEALVVTPAGQVFIITKDPLTPIVYTPSGPLRAGGTTPMKRLGTVTLPATDTSNPFGFAGRAVVTGAALAPGGDRVVIRTYADAFEFPVRDGDVAGALTGTARPARVPLPDEPQGEAVTYGADGRWLLTLSEKGPAGKPPTILRYPSALPPGPATTPPATAPSTPTATASPRTVGAADRSPAGPARWLPPLGVGVVGVAAAGLVAVIVLRTGRRRRS
ncbi:NHL repeat-containing protein [Rhizomonospora bruguierae]|uniref:hypothetical protein n=1 Tax=Rhizomonospora bruguierae TaxID=1581705 RepID=UPI001BCCDE2B|nr:hypothetical protein [Micromonospora sp. NBRC 107566]